MGKDFTYCDYLSLAKKAMTQEKYDEALSCFDSAILAIDAGSSVYYLKCELLFLLGRIEEAVTLMTKFGEQQDNITYTFYLTSKHFEYRAKMDEAAFWWGKYQDRVYGREKTRLHLSLVRDEYEEREK